MEVDTERTSTADDDMDYEEEQPTSSLPLPLHTNTNDEMMIEDAHPIFEETSEPMEAEPIITLPTSAVNPFIPLPIVSPGLAAGVVSPFMGTPGSTGLGVVDLPEEDMTPVDEERTEMFEGDNEVEGNPLILIGGLNGDLGGGGFVGASIPPIHDDEGEELREGSEAGGVEYGNEGLHDEDEFGVEGEEGAGQDKLDNKEEEVVEEVIMPQASSSRQPVLQSAIDTGDKGDEEEQHLNGYHLEHGDGDEEEYYEDEEEHLEDEEVEDDHTPLTIHTFPPIVLHIPILGARSLFSPLPSDEGNMKLPVWLEGRVEELGEASLSEVWAAIRSEMVKEGSGSKGAEMVIVEKQMALKMGEDDVNLRDITLLDLLQLHHACELFQPVQLYVHFETDRFITRYNAIQKEVTSQVEQRRENAEAKAKAGGEVAEASEGYEEDYAEEEGEEGEEGEDEAGEGNGGDVVGDEEGEARSAVVNGEKESIGVNATIQSSEAKIPHQEAYEGDKLERAQDDDSRAEYRGTSREIRPIDTVNKHPNADWASGLPAAPIAIRNVLPRQSGSPKPTDEPVVLVSPPQVDENEHEREEGAGEEEEEFEDEGEYKDDVESHNGDVETSGKGRENDYDTVTFNRSDRPLESAMANIDSELNPVPLDELAMLQEKKGHFTDEAVDLTYDEQPSDKASPHLVSRLPVDQTDDEDLATLPVGQVPLDSLAMKNPELAPPDDVLTDGAQSTVAATEFASTVPSMLDDATGREEYPTTPLEGIPEEEDDSNYFVDNGDDLPADSEVAATTVQAAQEFLHAAEDLQDKVVDSTGANHDESLDTSFIDSAEDPKHGYNDPTIDAILDGSAPDETASGVSAVGDQSFGEADGADYSSDEEGDGVFDEEASAVTPTETFDPSLASSTLPDSTTDLSDLALDKTSTSIDETSAPHDPLSEDGISSDIPAPPSAKRSADDFESDPSSKRPKSEA